MHNLVYITEVNVGDREKVSQIGIMGRPFTAFLKSLGSSLLSVVQFHLLCLLVKEIHLCMPVHYVTQRKNSLNISRQMPQTCN